MEPYPSPISYKGEYYYRSGSTKQELKGTALERFLLKKRGTALGRRAGTLVHRPVLQPPAIRLFKQRATESGRMALAGACATARGALGNLELTEKHGLKRAACLLFSGRPEKYVSGAWIKIGFFMTDDDLRYQDEVHGSLFEQVEKTLELLHVKYLKAYISYQGLHRRETFLFPVPMRIARHCSTPSSTRTTPAASPSRSACTMIRSFSGIRASCPENWTLERLRASIRRDLQSPAGQRLLSSGLYRGVGTRHREDRRECREHGIDPPAYDFGMAGLLTFMRTPTTCEPQWRRLRGRSTKKAPRRP